jgi:hypothetical protein
VVTRAVLRWLAPTTVLLLVAALGGSWWHGQKTGIQKQKDAYELQHLRTLQALAVEAQKIRDQDMEIMMGAVHRETTIRETVREIRIPVATPECIALGAEWVQQANQIMGANP